MTLMSFTRILTAILMIPYYLFNFVFNDYAYPAVSTEGAYLFCYFVGNEVDEQTIHLAVSTDGYNFEALNNNEAVIEQTKGTGCVRDPYILKGVDENGRDCYFIIATDMNALDGWTSNHCLITWKSYDLINWTDETVIDMRQFKGFETTNRAWAPQAIWDDNAGMYMVYWQIQPQKTTVRGIITPTQRISKPLKPSQRCSMADGTRLTPQRESFATFNALTAILYIMKKTVTIIFILKRI